MRTDGRPRRQASGFTLMEVTVAAIALGILTVGVLQAIVALDRARQATERIDYASRELDNLLERFIHQPWPSITQEAATEIQPPEEVAQHLPAATLETLVMSQTEPVDAKRITMKLRWRAHAEHFCEPLVLTAWVFPPEEVDP
jgi:type II secretory pathway pseudopilin PulG